ncbi:hypothetical protein SBA3_1090027 [Candidatus Sulfopaludibacter sp. SbA3]|nr:hypothetical protein SBA3_1090027 [Candidatus Sulfopaludibacter sp. SbA3]
MGNRSPDRAFCQSQVFIKEGIAQYYTDKGVEWFQQRNMPRNSGRESEARESMLVPIGRARENKQFLFLFVSNRLEKNAPLTILSLVDK